MSDELGPDIEEEQMLRLELAVAGAEALEIADKLALEVVDSTQKTPDMFRLCREYQEKRIHMRRIRGALKVAVSG